MKLLAILFTSAFIVYIHASEIQAPQEYIFTDRTPEEIEQIKEVTHLVSKTRRAHEKLPGLRHETNPQLPVYRKLF